MAKFPHLFEEIASAGAGEDFGGFVGEIAHPEDPTLKSIGGNLKAYDTVKLDDQVISTFQQRRRAVTSRDWGVEPGGDRPIDQEAADFLKSQLHGVKWDAKTDKMLWGVFYGYAVAELIYARDGNRIVLNDIKVRDRKRFRFGKDGALRLVSRTRPEGVVMPERKFWIFSAGADHDDDLYGRGLASWLWWPVFFKRNGMRFWAMALERFGQPTTVGKYPAGATEEDKKKLLAAVMAAAADKGLIIPEPMALEFLEATRRSGGDHAAFHAVQNAAISKVVLSQTMTTDDGSSRSQAAVHMEVRDDVVESDADLGCESFNNGPVRWLTDWNFPGAAYPKVWRLTKDPEDLNTAAERDERLSRIGYVPNQERIDETYGPGYERRASGARPEEPAVGFAESDEAAPDAIDELTGRLDQAAGPAMDELIDRIREIVFAEGATLEDVAARLVELYPDLRDADLAAAIQGALVTAHLQGAAGIVDQS